MSKDANYLKKILQAAKTEITIGGRYRHYKGGEYIVGDIILDEATLEPLVVYQAQYDDRLTFARPISSWLETVEHSGNTVPRFTRVK